jgi:predicted enzyme related to lactoylglutathione lyase
MPKNPVVHFEIIGMQYDKCKAFYETVFDWEIKEWETSMVQYGMTEHSGEGTIGGGIMQSPREFGRPATIFYIQVDDLKAYLAKVEANGGRMVSPPTPIPGIGSSAAFADPDGNVIGLFCEKQEIG